MVKNLVFEVRNEEIEAKLRDTRRLRDMIRRNLVAGLKGLLVGREAGRKEIGQRMKLEIPKGFGFTLLIFSYDQNTMFYLSSAERKSMIAAMQEFIQRQEPWNPEA